jgi:hypothetical protein
MEVIVQIVWQDGINNYKKYTHDINMDTKIHSFNTELLEVPDNNYSSLSEYCVDILQNRTTKFVDVLYSGGLDSELVLTLCLQNNIPVRAVTMKLMVNEYPLNTHDLYYSEKFCRANKVEQILINLDVEKFFESGQHYNYLKPYLITQPHVATHFWLFEQCDGFPVLGGEYSWPWSHKPLLSPHRHQFSYYDKFLVDNNIDGIGNFMNYCNSSNLLFIKNHLEVVNSTSIATDFKNIPIFKQKLWVKLNLPSPELRLRSYGWESAPFSVIDLAGYKLALTEEFGKTYSSITWGKTISNIIGEGCTTNDKYR